MAKKSVYETVTDEILEALEQGVRPWNKCWAGDLCSLPLRHTGQAYRGINVLALWCKAISKGYQSPYWMTLKQANALGGKVRKGEKSTVVTRPQQGKDKRASEETGEDKYFTYFAAYRVFNADQIEGLGAKFHPSVETKPVTPMPEIEAYFQKTGAVIRHVENRAYYNRKDDFINMPEAGLFDTTEHYYSTLAHEVIHWTGSDKRLERTKGKVKFDKDYALEELVAEIGAAFLSAGFGIRQVTKEDSDNYLGYWIAQLKNDKRFIFKAAGAAQKAVEYLETFQSEQSSQAA